MLVLELCILLCIFQFQRSSGEEPAPAANSIPKVSNGGLALIHPAPPLTPSNWG